MVHRVLLKAATAGSLIYPVFNKENDSTANNEVFNYENVLNLINNSQCLTGSMDMKGELNSKLQKTMSKRVECEKVRIEAQLEKFEEETRKDPQRSPKNAQELPKRMNMDRLPMSPPRGLNMKKVEVAIPETEEPSGQDSEINLDNNQQQKKLNHLEQMNTFLQIPQEKKTIQNLKGEAGKKPPLPPKNTNQILQKMNIHHLTIPIASLSLKPNAEVSQSVKPPQEPKNDVSSEKLPLEKLKNIETSGKITGVDVRKQMGLDLPRQPKLIHLTSMRVTFDGRRPPTKAVLNKCLSDSVDEENIKLSQPPPPTTAQSEFQKSSMQTANETNQKKTSRLKNVMDSPLGFFQSQKHQSPISNCLDNPTSDPKHDDGDEWPGTPPTTPSASGEATTSCGKRSKRTSNIRKSITTRKSLVEMKSKKQHKSKLKKLWHFMSQKSPSS